MGFKKKRDNKFLKEYPDIRQKIVSLAIDVERAKMLQRKVLCIALTDEVPTSEAAMFKLFSTELHQKIANLALDILSWEGLFHKDSKDAIENGKWEWSYRGTLVDTIGAGASEIQKNTIAKKALNLPL